MPPTAEADAPNNTATAPAAAADPNSPGGVVPTRQDLHNPLNQIIGYTDLLLAEAVDAGAADGPEAALRAADLMRIRDASMLLLERIEKAFGDGDAVETMTPTTTARRIPTSDFTIEEMDDERDHFSGGLVLVADKDVADRDLLSRWLERQGHTVTTSTTGEETLTLLREAPFDVVLLDMKLPDMDGPTLLKRIKENERTRHLPVIMTASRDETDAVVRTIALGAEDYLPKPFDATLLSARVGASMEKKRLRDREARLYQKLEANYKRLQELEKLRDDLTHMVVHDLRTPLTSIITGLETMRVIGELDDTQQEFLDIALTGGQTLLGLINDLLDVSKLEDGSMTLDRQPIPVAPVIESALAQITHLARDKRITLVAQPDDDLPPLSADAEKLRRVLVNLLGNALKFTPGGGTVTVFARRGEGDDANHALFAVRDTGEGIPEEAFARIFEKFGQVEGRKAGRRNSTGLGLTFCKMVAEAHGGRIWVESTIGIGSTFYFTIPFAAAAS